MFSFFVFFQDGLYSSLPYAGRLVTGLFCSYLSDKLQRSGLLSTGGCRKLFQVVGKCVGVCSVYVRASERFKTPRSTSVCVCLSVSRTPFH